MGPGWAGAGGVSSSRSREVVVVVSGTVVVVDGAEVVVASVVVVASLGASEVVVASVLGVAVVGVVAVAGSTRQTSRAGPKSSRGLRSFPGLERHSAATHPPEGRSPAYPALAGRGPAVGRTTLAA